MGNAATGQNAIHRHWALIVTLVGFGSVCCCPTKCSWSIVSRKKIERKPPLYYFFFITQCFFLLGQNYRFAAVVVANVLAIYQKGKAECLCTIVCSVRGRERYREIQRDTERYRDRSDDRGDAFQLPVRCAC